MRKGIRNIGLLTAVTTLVFTGCASQTAKAPEAPVAEKKHIVYAKGVGPYTELFEEAVLPRLEEQGYTFSCTELDLGQADAALASGDVDVSVEQHKAYMNAFNKEANGNLVALTPIPTVPASVFSNQHTSLEELTTGMTIAVPEDPGNQARAYAMLQDMGWITLKEGTDFATATEEDIASNPYQLKFYGLQTSYIATSLSDFDYGIITGSVVYNAGIDPSTALFKENLSENFWLQVVVSEENEAAQWAKDIVAVYESEAFLKWLEENNGSTYQALWSIPTYK